MIDEVTTASVRKNAFRTVIPEQDVKRVIVMLSMIAMLSPGFENQEDRLGTRAFQSAFVISILRNARPAGDRTDWD